MELITEDDVRKEVVRYLNIWQQLGVVLNWERINCGRVQSFGKWFYGAKAGFPDYFAEVINGKIIHICYFETKRPDGGVWSDEQKEFNRTHTGFDNVTYDLVTDPKIVNVRIESITKYYDKKLEEASLHIGG